MFELCENSSNHIVPIDYPRRDEETLQLAHKRKNIFDFCGH